MLWASGVIEFFFFFFNKQIFCIWVWNCSGLGSSPVNLWGVSDEKSSLFHWFRGQFVLEVTDLLYICWSFSCLFWFNGHVKGLSMWREVKGSKAQRHIIYLELRPNAIFEIGSQSKQIWRHQQQQQQRWWITVLCWCCRNYWVWCVFLISPHKCLLSSFSSLSSSLQLCSWALGDDRKNELGWS